MTVYRVIYQKPWSKSHDGTVDCGYYLHLEDAEKVQQQYIEWKLRTTIEVVDIIENLTC